MRPEVEQTRNTVRALITGMNGFAGSHLADFLSTQPGVEIFGAGIGATSNIAHLAGRATFIPGDLTDACFVESLLTQTRPERVYHLAGQAFPPASWQDPWATLETNIRAEANILHTAARLQTSAPILVIGSMDEYGRIASRDLPITEETPLRPDSPYGVSKIAQDFLGLQYFLSHQLPIVRVRPSNHIGPRQNEQFVASNFAKQIAEIELGAREPVLRVGNLDARRDFTDVRDMVRAYYLALERGIPGEVYNIGSERAIGIQTIVEMLLQHSRVATRVEQDPTRFRPSDSPVLYCSVTKFRAQTGWQPTIPLEQSLRDILDYWRDKVSK
jgi:GDP-4-dehydro-6-deoxy-D-mannose reductase